MRLVFLLCFFCFACKGGPVPAGVLPPQKMEAVWYDVIRVDEWADFAILQDSSFRNFSRRAALYDSVFRLHAITKDDYRKSVAFYQSRPDLLKNIFQDLRNRSDTTLKHLGDTAKPNAITEVVK